MKINALVLYVICFLLLALLPSIMDGHLSQNSRTPGLLVASVIVFLFLHRYLKSIRVPIYLVNIVIFILFWIAFIPIITGSSNFTLKAFSSLFSLFFILLFAFLIEVWFKKCDDQRLYKLIIIICIIFCVTGWVCFLKKVGIGNIPFIFFPFGEPSHFARIAGPIYVISFFVITKKYKYFLLMNAFLQAVLIQSLSLFLYTLIIPIVVLQSRIIKFIAPIFITIVVIVIVLIINPIYWNYFTSRLTLSSENGNLTSLVMLQGIVAAKNSLINTSGLGLGFQMLGTEEPNEISFIISNILTNGGELNRTDGGFVAAKLIAELGIVGVILCCFVLLKIFGSLFWLRRYWMHGIQNKVIWSNYEVKKIIANTLIVTFSIEMFLRGGGYFSLTIILFIVSLIHVHNTSIKDNSSYLT